MQFGAGNGDGAVSNPLVSPKIDAVSDAKVGKGRAAVGRTFAWAGIRIFILMLIGALVVVVAREWNWWVSSSTLQSTDDAYLEADTTPLAAKVPGYVSRVRVQDFQRVHAGDVMVEIVDDDYRAQLDQAQANVAAAGAAIGNIEQQQRLQETLIKQAEADVAAGEADVTRYHLETVRQQKLLSDRYAGTPQLVEQAIDNEKRADAALAVNRAKLDQQRQQMNVLDSQKTQAIAALQAQKAARDLAAINLGYTRISAPVDGMVSERLVRPGQYLSVGTQVISLVPLPNVWVIANYKETQMTHIRTGQKARVTVDAFPGTVLHGKVDSWSPASGSEFALLPPDNATGNFTKVVQRIPVKIVLEPDPPLADLLRPGMSVIATIDTSSTPADAAAAAGRAQR
ncbi:MAG TPA: HlyD family secretion protein [Xanthobacteraceae bacterium]|jgi:membrane fusion protein (multidrug efflux system)